MRAGPVIAAFLVLLTASLAAEPAAAGSPRVAVVLSGGSALGISHAGVLQAIEKAGIPIDMVVGTSMGAIVAGLYAAGYSPEAMGELVDRLDWSEIFAERRDTPGDRYDYLKRREYPFAIPVDDKGLSLGSGLLSGQNVLSSFTELVLHILSTRDFDELPVPYRAVAADVVTGEKVVFASGSIAEAMRSSMSVPGIFRPYEIDGRYLIDGGIVDDIPADVARAMGADIIISVESRGMADWDPKTVKSGVSVSAQSINLLIEQNRKLGRAVSDLVIRPDLRGLGYASYSQARELISRGREAGEAAMPELRSIALRISASRALVGADAQANRAAFREPPVFAELRVVGGNAEDRALAQTRFSRLLGRAPGRAEAKAAIDALFSTGRYDYVRLELQRLPPLQGGAEQAAAVLRLTPAPPIDSAALLGWSFRGLLSPLSENESFVSTALLFRNLSGPGSALFAQAGFVTRTDFALELYQPFGPVYFKPFASYDSQFDALESGQELRVLGHRRRVGAGAWLGLNFGKYADLAAGYSIYNVKTVADGSLDIASLNAEFSADTRPTTVFPARGGFAMVRGKRGFSALSSDLDFVSMELEAGLDIPLSEPLTLGMIFYGGTDFSGFLPVRGSLPSESYFDFQRAGMFYGLEPRPLRDSGNTVAAFAIEPRYRIGEASPLLGGDVYLFFNASLGTARAVGSDVTYLPLRWNTSLGAGLRILPQLGLKVCAGVVEDGNRDASLRPTLSIEFGTFMNSLDEP